MINESDKTKQLKLLIENIRNSLTKNSISNKLVIVNSFLYYIGLNYLKDYLDKDCFNNEEIYKKEIVRLNSLFPYFFDKIDANDYVYIKIDDNKVFEKIINNSIYIGSLYQYFNNQTKKDIYSQKQAKNKINKDDVSIATQIFTPDWITNYLVNNTLNKFLEIDYSTNDYIVEEIQKGKEDKNQNKEIKIIDPCMGTGNILLYVFDKLYSYYIKKSKQKDNYQICKDIIEECLYGFDIDYFACKIIKFSLVLKVIQKNIERITNLDEIKEKIQFRFNLIYLNNSIIPNSSYLGSLIKDCSNPLISKLLTQKYDIVLTNPPYMGRKSIDNEIKEYLNKFYTFGKGELYAAFIERCIEMCKNNGYIGMITIHSWMFINSFKELRKELINSYFLESMIHSGAGTFSELNAFNALATAFIINKRNRNDLTTFIRLADEYNIEKKKREFFNKDNYYYVNIKRFLDIPNYPFIYFVNERVFSIFKDNIKLKELFIIKQGLATGDNKRFVKYWYEVNKEDICFNANSTEEAIESKKKWFPYNKGGNFCKWYGMNEYIVDWENNGYEIKNNLNKKGKLRSRPQNQKYYFKEGITWSLFGFENFGVRYKPNGFIFDVSGSSMFPIDNTKKYQYYVLSFLCSKVAFYLLSSIAPTVNFQIGNIGDLPIILDDKYLDEINTIAIENINLCKENWDNQEISWDFTEHKLVTFYGLSLHDALDKYILYQNNLYNRLKTNEERLNTIFNQIYRLDIDPIVIDRDITIKRLTKKDEEKIIKSYISYLIKNILETERKISLNDLETKINKILKESFIEYNDNDLYRFT